MKKMLPLVISLLIAFSLTVTVGCRSSKKALEHGNYYEACILAIQKLRSSPTNKTAAESLKQAYPLLLQTTQININNTLSQNASTKYRTIYNEYVKLNTVYNNILTSPGALRVISSPTLFMTEQNAAQQNAAIEIMTEADALLKDGSHLAARRAYFLYGDALRLDPNSQQIKERQVLALDIATVKVVLEQIPVIPAYNLSSGFFFDQIFTSLNTDRRSQFLAFYRPDEAERLGLVPDHVVRMAFDDFVVGQITDKKTIADVSRDSVVVGNVKMPDGTVQDVYNTITAKLTMTTRKVESKGLMSIQITDYSSKQLLAHEKFEGVYSWETAWGKYRGDSRALTEKQLRICDSDPMPVPPAQELFLEFTKPIFTDVSNFLLQFYKAAKYTN